VVVPAGRFGDDGGGSGGGRHGEPSLASGEGTREGAPARPDF
jgi:hypothetical protein